MEVFLLVRSIPHPQAATDSYAPQLGDIVEFRRTDKTKWGKELKHFTIAKVDLTIPCGNEFKKRRCADCKDASPDVCDVQKYIQPEFSAGSIDEEPRLLRKRRYRAVYVPPKEVKDKVDLGLEKTQLDESAILSWASSNLQQTDIIRDKKA